MTAFATLFACLSMTLFLLWLAERSEVRFWREASESWRDRYCSALERERFWRDEAWRSPLHGKPKEIPRA